MRTSRQFQKIDKTLRLVGLSDFHAYGTPSIPDDIQHRNRVWICLPRNRLGLKQFARYEKEARFKFRLRGDSEDRTLRWRSARDPGKWLEIHSPLNKYLEEQRKGMTGGRLKSQHLQVVARDYAVLARFSDTADRPMDSETVKDFFFAGLRGLGTWGAGCAGWYLDRQYQSLLQYEQQLEQTIQLLLEVTYVNGRIETVRDVSDESEGYFQGQNDRRTVRKVVRDLNPHT